MILRVQYKNHDYDYVDTQRLDRLLLAKEVRKFFRPSEERWVDVSRDPVRGSGGGYSGPNKRQPRKTPKRHIPFRSV
jgi:hypothetical protein